VVSWPNLFPGLAVTFFVLDLVGDKEELFEFSYTKGARIHSNSWGNMQRVRERDHTNP